MESTILEKDILLKANHPFLVGMSYVFQTENKVLFVMKFVRGGELFGLLRKVQRFSEENCKLYCAMICAALGYLHEQNIVYRDLKPENVLIE